MNAQSSRTTLEQLLSDAGLSPERLTAPEALAAVVAYYRDHRADDCAVDADGDMLLYQWGPSGGEAFEWNLTRQFIVSADAEDDAIWQLSLTLKFTPTDALRALTPGNKWCPDPSPQTLNEFELFVRASPAYQAVADARPVAVELDYFNAG